MKPQIQASKPAMILSEELRQHILHMRRELTAQDRSPLYLRQKLSHRVTELLTAAETTASADLFPNRDIQELSHLVDGMTGWTNTQAFQDESLSDDDWFVGSVDVDGRQYPVLAIQTANYDAGDAAEAMARYYAALNPAKVQALLDKIVQLESGPQNILAADLVKQLVDQAQLIPSTSDDELDGFAVVLLASAERIKRQENQIHLSQESILCAAHALGLPIDADALQVVDAINDLQRNLAKLGKTSQSEADLLDTPQPNATGKGIPAGLYRELQALRTLRDVTRVSRDRYMLDEIDDSENCVTAEQHETAIAVNSALDTADAVEWNQSP